MAQLFPIFIDFPTLSSLIKIDYFFLKIILECLLSQMPSVFLGAQMPGVFLGAQMPGVILGAQIFEESCSFEYLF